MFHHRIINHKNIYFFGLIILICGLPLSVFLMSMSQFVLIINWILELHFKNKWEKIKQNPSILLFSSIYILHLIGMLYSSWGKDYMDYALNDLRIKLPILLLPLIIGTTEPLNKKEIKILLYLFILSVFIGTLFTNVRLLSPIPLIDFRLASSFISHIRFSLMMTLSIFIILFYLSQDSIHLTIKLLYFLLIAWFLFSMIMLKSLTGLILLYFTGLVLLIIYFKHLNNLLRIALVTFLLCVVIYSYLYISKIYNDFYHINTIQQTHLPSVTKNGFPYFNDTTQKEYENGFPIWTKICYQELKSSWNKRSSLPYDSLDNKQNKLYITLIRYLTSKGLSKDSDGLSKLSDKEIRLIENGIANVVYSKKMGLYSRIYEVIWEIDHYKKYHDPNGQSVVQRLEFFKTGLLIFKEHTWFGVGTADVEQSFNKMYLTMNSKLDPKNYLRAHNQYLTFLLTFGIFGFIWIMFVLFYIPYKVKRYHNYLFLSTFLISMLSWFNEDTLETQAGVTFFTVFYLLFIFGMRDDK